MPDASSSEGGNVDRDLRGETGSHDRGSRRLRDSARVSSPSVAVLLFSTGLSFSNVALPLAMLGAGFGAGRIGVLTAVSAVAQLAARPSVPWLASRFPDRALVGFAGVSLAVACAVAAVSHAMTPFVLAEVAQGAARAFFWSGSQLHAVRQSSSSVRGIARINLISGIGALTGPAAAGAVSEWSISAALMLASCLAVGAWLAALRMDRLALLTRPAAGNAPRVYTRRPVVAACIASASAGVWSSLNASYIPVVLAREHSASTVGLMIALANGGNMLASVGIGHRRVTSATAWIRPAALLGGVGLALVGLTAATAPVAGLLLLLAGLGCGVLVTLGPALATDAVDANERAQAIALAGTFRAGAMFLAPMAVAAQLVVMPLPVALLVVGGFVTLPGLQRPGLGKASHG